MSADTPGPLDDRHDLPRRDVVGMILAALVASAAAGLASLSMGMRFLRPKVKPFDLIAGPDQADVAEQVVAQLTELRNVWDCKDFIFRQVNVEYTPKGQQTVEIPGFAVRVPDQTGEQDKHYVKVYSRICPHLGCIFNFEIDPSVVARNYGGFRPDGPVFACPCHLSIYDLAQGGKVVSGPAPRPPDLFEYKIEGDDVIVTGLSGGLA